MNELNDLGESLEASLAKNDLVDIAAGLSDYTFEMILAAGDNIPLLSYLTKGFKAVSAVRDYVFLEKVIAFLNTVGSIPSSQRLKMIEDIQSDNRYNEKFGKVSLIALERYDNKSKAKLLGQAAKYLAREEINFELYRRLAYIIDRMYVDDIYLFAKGRTPYPDDKVYNLESLGLIRSSYHVTVKLRIGRSNETLPEEVMVKREDTFLGLVFKSIVLEAPINSLILNVSLEAVVAEVKQVYGTDDLSDN